jgi:hypothetical protein
MGASYEDTPASLPNGIYSSGVAVRVKNKRVVIAVRLDHDRERLAKSKSARAGWPGNVAREDGRLRRPSVAVISVG